MPDITIPGVSSRFNTDKIVEDLMKVEKIPLTKMEARVEELEADKNVWRNLQNRISTLSAQCTSMYNYDNPFAERVVSSSDNAVTATAVRNADLTEHLVKVIQTAAGDKLITSPIEQDSKIPAGHYVFAIGEKDVSYFFNGGSPKSFVDGLNRRSSDLLRAQIIQARPGEQVILLESRLTGADNAIRFEGDAKQLAEHLGWIRPVRQSDGLRTTSVDLSPYTQSNPYRIQYPDSGCLLNPGESISVAIESGNAESLLIRLKTVDLSENPDFKSGKKPFSMDIIGTATFKSVTLLNETSVLPDEISSGFPSEAETPAETVFITVEGSSDSRKMPLIRSVGDMEEWTLSLSEFGEIPHSVFIENRSERLAVAVESISISERTGSSGNADERGVNAIETARDAVFEYDGIKLTRPINQISDVNDQITFTLNAPTSEPVSLKVGTNAEAVKDKIIEFAYNYNKLIEDINIYSTRDEKILDELSYLEPAEREEKEKVLGILQGDVTLIQTKNRLQQIVNNSYDIQSPDQISMLFQLGIGSNLSAYSGYSAARMRGYLEIDEAKLDEAVRNNINDLQKIFGFDTNNDYITDNGIAFLMNEYLTSFSQQGGIIDGKIQTYDRQIAQQERDITNFNDRMEKKEADYKRQFGNMEAMYERLKDSSRALDSLNTNNRNE